MIKHMRIKRVYLDQIRSGTKSVEYRSIKPCYNYLKNPKPKYLCFHYQTRDRVLVEIEHIRVIPRTRYLENTGIEFTPKVYAIKFKVIKKRVYSEI